MEIRHALVPRITKLSTKEAAELLKRLGVDAGKLPRIRISDPSLANLNVSIGDIVKIHRISTVTGKEAPYWRTVVSD